MKRNIVCFVCVEEVLELNINFCVKINIYLRLYYVIVLLIKREIGFKFDFVFILEYWVDGWYDSGYMYVGKCV